MSGIVFFATETLEETVGFYESTMGASRWLDQPDCTILQYDNMLFGFCDRESAETDGTITFVYGSRADVDVMYEKLSDRATGEPVENERYQIYQFFATDPEGRTIECQSFDHETAPI